MKKEDAIFIGRLAAGAATIVITSPIWISGLAVCGVGLGLIALPLVITATICPPEIRETEDDY